MFFNHLSPKQLYKILLELNYKVNILMATMQDLTNAVTRQSSAEDGVLTMLQGISQQLKDAQSQNNPQAIQDVITQIDANTQRLSDAVTANTPASGDAGTATSQPSA
jgi:hypothetical protein